MRPRNYDLNELLSKQQINPAIAKQIQQARLEVARASPMAAKKLPKPAESQGEASVRVALMHAFGDWFRGGEVVCEFRPFSQREFRADFALPRYRAVIEVDGWQHHGRSLDAHHSDRVRRLYFAQYGWMVFPLSHKQAVSQTTLLIDALTCFIDRTEPRSRESINIERIMTAKASRTQLIDGHDD